MRFHRDLKAHGKKTLLRAFSSRLQSARKKKTNVKFRLLIGQVTWLTSRRSKFCIISQKSRSFKSQCKRTFRNTCQKLETQCFRNGNIDARYLDEDNIIVSHFWNISYRICKLALFDILRSYRTQNHLFPFFFLHWYGLMPLF